MYKVNPWPPRKAFSAIVSETKSAAETLLKAKIAKLGPAGPQPEKRIIEPVFGKYVTRNIGFRQELEDLAATLKHYIQRQKVKRPFNILLASEPGSGKSFLLKQLVKCLEDDIEVQFDEYHVAAFRSIEDLHGAWQRVQSANLHGKLPFVFFDEVDGKVGNQYLLANFLGPMWDGVFYVGKDSFALGRAILAFAASSMVPSPGDQLLAGLQRKTKKETPDASAQLIPYRNFFDTWQDSVQKKIATIGSNKKALSQESRPIEKCKDFVDRVDRMICIPPTRLELLGDDFEAELMDIACLLVTKHFEHVEEIERLALMALTVALKESSSRRRAERCVFCSRPETIGRFAFKALPREMRDRFEQEEPKSDLKSYPSQWVKVTIKERKTK